MLTDFCLFSLCVDIEICLLSVCVDLDIFRVFRQFMNTEYRLFIVCVCVDTEICLSAA